MSTNTTQATAFQAHGTPGHVTSHSPRQAATEYFCTFPSSRKCSITQGTYDGQFFTVTVNRANPPQSFKDVTRKTIASLPD